MNLRKIFLFTLAFSISVFAGKVITYTASSAESQEQANNTAIAGVAKQVSAHVKSDDRLHTSDVMVNGKESINETYSSSKNVKTNIDLKWVKVTVLPKEGKRFRATATLDIDEMTNNIRLQLATAREKVAKYEAAGRAALEESRYDEAIRNLNAGLALVKPYSELKLELAQIFTLDESYNLKHDLPGLRSLIASRLANIRIETVPAKLVLAEDVIKDLSVTVSDSKGIVTDFPLKVLQDGKKLDSRRTQDNGIAMFTIPKVNFSSGLLAVSFIPDFPPEILKAAGLEKGFVVPYEVKQAKCNVRLKCKGNGGMCKAFSDQLAKNSVFVGTAPTYPLLTAEIESFPKNSMNGLLSYSVSVSVSGEGVSFSTTSKGVGKTEAEAVTQAISKIKLKELGTQVKAVCGK